MNKVSILLTVALVTSAGGAFAGEQFFDRGRVINSEPIYETVTINQPEERCWNERVRHHRHGRNKSYTPTIAGAIVGGVVGNQFGKGSGKDLMTVAGAVLGASVGNDLSKKHPSRSYVTDERRCEVVDNYREHEELVGYRVKYHYQGKTFWTQTDQEPGRYIPLQVSIAPQHDRGYGYR